jgi:hypothetical protein
VLGVLACSSDAPPPAVVNGAPVVGPAADPNGAACAGATGDRPAGSSCVGVVRGQLLDSANAPVTAPLSVCGGGVLCMGSAASEGLFDVTVNRYVDLSTFVLWVYGFPNHAEMIMPLERASTTDITLNALPRVPRYEFMGDVLPPSTATGGVFRSGPVELTLAAGTVTAVQPAHESMRNLHVGAVPDMAKWGADLVALYALGPPSSRFSSNVGVALTLPAVDAVPDGTVLDLVVLDDEFDGGHPGTLVTVASATVTKGVARSAVGIDRLTWVGVRVPKGN